MSVTSRFVAIDASLKNVSPIHGYESESLVSIEEALKDVEPLINDLCSRIKVAREKCHFPSEHGLTQDESACIYIYTMEWGNSSLYRVLNKALRSKNREALKTWFPYLKLFDVALNKLPGAKEVVWRGVPLDIGKDFVKNQTLTWWSINSCTSSVDVVKGFLGVDKKSTLFLIETCNGRKISGYTAHEDEDEMILPIGSKFRVKSNSLDQSYGSHVVHLIEIDDKTDQSGALVMNQMKSDTISPCKNSLDATEIVMSLRMDDVLECAMSILHTDSKLKGLIEKELKKMAVGDTGELFAIFYGSGMIANAEIDKPDEKEMLYLLLNYLLSKIENEGETDETTKLFSFSDEQRNKMKNIFHLLKQWFVDLIIVNSIRKSSEQIQDVKLYATSLKKRLQNLRGICILPSGFAKVTWNTSNSSNFLMLETQYTGPHSMASIIEFKSKKYKHLTHIDPISFYDRSFRELTADKISLGLEIKKIPPEKFDDNFFLLLMTLRIIAGSESYESSYLYEIVLSKLGGKGHINNEKEFFVNLEEKGFFSLSWTLVKNVFYYLLKKLFHSQEASSLYAKIICEFQFKLLISGFDKYVKLENDDKLNRLKYQFLLHEMCKKVAYDVVNCLTKKTKVVIDWIVRVQERIACNNKKSNVEKCAEKIIKKTAFRHTNFQSFLHEDLQGLKFIQSHITKSLGSSSSNAIRKQISFDTISFEKNVNNKELIQFSKILDEITKYYGFNRVIQISQLIEHFVLSFAHNNGFRNWHNDEKYNIESGRILIRVALLYYNCSAIIMSELFPDQNFAYEPTYYTKLVLVLFGLLAMMDDLVRNDKTIGSSLTNYSLSTELENISLESVLPQLALPERKWFCLLNNIKTYFNLSATNTEKLITPGTFLFHYSSLSMENDSDKNNIDVIFMLNILKNNFTGNYKKFEGTFKEVKVDELKNKWQELLFSDKYIPESLRHLRDIAYLSQLSLYGFSVRAIQKIKSPQITSSDTYSRFEFSCSESPKISDLDIDVNCVRDKWRFVDFTLPKNPNKYQRLIASDFDQKQNISMSENEIIGTQSEKPDNLSRPQYYRLNSIQLHDDLKFTLMYIALKSDEINFETEEHCYLVKQVLHKVGICEERCLLEKQFQNENFATALVKKFIDIVVDLQERIVQYKSIGHALDILIYLYTFCSDNVKHLIDRCLEGLRVAVLKYINEKTMTSNIKNRQDVESILSCYYILTFKNSVMIDEKQVSQILKLRILIDNNSKLYGFISASLYTKTMITIFELTSKIESVIDKNLSMLDGYISSSHGSWKKDASMNFYVKDSYSFLHLKGRLFHNGHPLVCFPDQIFNNSHYKECFGIQNFLVEGVDRNVFGQILRCYETKRKESENFRITCLGGDNIWIENENETFVPKTYLSKLPRFLLQNSTHFDNDQTVYYSHWWNENKIYIRNHDKKVLKNENKSAKFTIDLKTNEIYSNEHKKYLIPFVKDGFDQSNVLYSIFSRFEDQNYILALKDHEQDSEPVMIFLSRLNLKFKISGTKVISEDFKDYCLSSDQLIDTLFGLSQYLVLEPDIQNKFSIRFNRKIIIAYHPIEKKPFYSNIIQFNLNKVGKPAHFSYEIDENLRCINSETTAGSLYLALLYFKTATLDKDPFLEMNSYEACSEILKTCWQNCQYSDTEFNIILKFFENKCPDLEKPWSNYAGKEEEMFKTATHGENPHHRNTHAIFLRLIYLLLSSYQTDFLIKADVNNKNLYHYFLQKSFVKYHFNFYLIFKDRIDKRCRLTLEEENKLLSDYAEKDDNSRISDYYKFTNDKTKLQLVPIKLKDFKSLENSLFSSTLIKECKYTEEMAKILTEKLSSSYYSHKNKRCSVNNLFSDWVNIKYNFSYFAALYRIARDLEKYSEFNKDTFSYFLSYLFLRAPDEEKFIIRMLYIVSCIPKAFKSLPKFMLLETNEIDNNQGYNFNKHYRRFNEFCVPNIYNVDDAINEEVKTSIWLLLKNKYLNQDEQSKFSVKELVELEFKEKFHNDVEIILKQKNVFDISQYFPNELYENLICRAKNKEYYDFVINIAKRCNKTVHSHEIGNTVINTRGLSDFTVGLSVEEMENQINKIYAYSEINESDSLNLEWNVKGIDIKEHYEKLKNYFYIESYTPQNIHFPLDPEKLHEDSVVRKIFSKGYGKTFIADLEESYGQQLPIFKIHEKYFSVLKAQSKNGFDLLKDLKLDYEEELNYLESRLNENKNELLSDVKKWIINENSQKYISSNERDKIITITIEFEDQCKKINNELLKRKILLQPLTFEPLKNKLDRLRNDIKFKTEAKIWARNLEDIEEKLDQSILENENLWKIYLKYIHERRIVSSVILKLVCERRKINILVYERLDASVFELKVIEKYSYTGDECKEQLQLWVNNEMFSAIQTQEIIDNKILEKLENNSSIVGYLRTEKEETQLKSEFDIDSVNNALLKRYSKYQEKNIKLFEEIHKNITSITNISNKAYIFVLHRIIGEKFEPTKKEILSLLKDINKIKEFNPFIINQKQEFYEKIECYLVQETLIQQMTKVILLISKYKSLDINNDKNELGRMLQNILINTVMERSYNTKEYPSWLLFETENNLLIRNTQYCLIEKMMNDKSNSFYQLNMGEGKTSVILMILSEMLANGKQIARINCLEPLMGVMLELLRNKFHGLLQKKIYTMPFSRGVMFSTENLEKIKEMFTECQNGKQILLVTPEQRLCFQLKKQETFLEYLQSKDADDCFNWEEHHHRTRVHYQKYDFQPASRNAYSLTSNQRTLKKALQSLGYIDEKDKIVKYPRESNEDFKTFFQEVIEKTTENGSYSISIAYEILRDRSTQVKTQRQKKLELLYLLDEFQFFDILDESDEILRHGKELNYTLGSSKPLDGGLLRWEIPFLIFKMIFVENEIVEKLKVASKRVDCPVIFQENFRPINGIGGGSPLVRFVKYDYFMQHIRPDLCQKLCEILLSRFQVKKTEIIDDEDENYGTYEDFILGKCLSREDKIIQLLKGKSQDILNSILLAKAWLSHELLFHVMSYRYRVDFGLSEKREKEIAIPFRGKDLPSENSEFSHPDIMIGFTTLSYLYKGLDLKQVRDGLIKLKTDPQKNRDHLLQQWIQENKDWIDEQVAKEKEEFPEWLRSFKTLDLEDENRIKRIHRYLSRNFNFIEYYLCNFTFPNDTKYYEKKLTGNAHTLAGEGQTKGFSGTDDRNDTMPEAIISKRLLSQEGTNGKMLHILSREINNTYETKIEISSTVHLLDHVCAYAKKNKDCYILIDAGAIVTEMNNVDVSEYLIKNMDERFEGVIHFSDKTNQIMVILRNEEYLPLSACHIDNKRLFVYLDEVHTRGTDLKLPLTARGIVTLGKNMNKDKLMQAVMRLRDLDCKQSIVLWGSKEISADIATISNIEIKDITTKDVLIWVTYNTIRKNENDLYPVVKEKFKYVVKSRAFEYQKKLKDIPMDSLTNMYVTKSLDSIEQSYGTTPQTRNPTDLLQGNIGAYLDSFYSLFKIELEKKGQDLTFSKEIDRNQHDVDRPKMESMLKCVRKKLPNSILTVNTDYNCDQETEREIEEMQHAEVHNAVEKASSVEVPWDFNVVFDKDLKEKGFRGENGYPKLKELKECFEFTDIRYLRRLKWHNKVFATENFIKTIEDIDMKNNRYQTDYLKPVNMILIHRIDKELYYILISQFEAQNLIKLFRKKRSSKVSIMHIEDINGPTMFPTNAIPLTKEEINNTIVVIRLFNGDCHYNTEEVNVIKKCVAFVGSDVFHEDKSKSEQIYNELESRHYLTKGFMTRKLATKLANENEKILLETEAKLEVDLQSRLHSIVNESIAEDVDSVSKLPNLIRELIRIRGKSEQYQRSALRNIIDKNQA